MPAENCGFSQTDMTLKLSRTAEAIIEPLVALTPKARGIQLRSFPSLEITILKTEIKDQEGNVTKVIG